MAAADGPVLDLGCVYCNAPNIRIMDEAPETGTYIAALKYVFSEILVEFGGVEGEPLLMPIGNLGSPQAYPFHVQTPTGGALILTVDGVEYECFRFCIKVVMVGDDAEPVDFADVTCEQLQEGLTDEQVLGCILPGIDFATEEAQEALTEQQRTDLIAYLCSETPMAQIIHKADAAAAIADDTTIITDQQLLVLDDTGRTYIGGANTPKALVEANKFLLPVTENSKGFEVVTNGETLQIQLNEP